MDEKRYDPMTGELIQEEVKEATDTKKTAEVKEVVESPAAENNSNPTAEMNFDPMTGKPIQKEEEMNFDPMTGKPIQKEEEVNFDPMTGKPIQKEEEMNFDPMTGKPIQNMGERSFGNNAASSAPKKSKMIWAIVAAAAVLVIVIVAVASGVFLGKSNRLLLAVKNTFEEQPRFIEDLKLDDMMNWVESGKYTVNVKVDAMDGAADVSYTTSSSEMQVYGNIEGSGMPETEFLGSLTKDDFRVQLPSVSDVVFVYNYREEADGELFEELDEEEIEAFNELLVSCWDTDAQEEISEEIQDAFLEAYKGLEIESIDSKKFEIDGRERKCKGYALTVTADDVLDFWDEVESIYEDAYESDMDGMQDTLREMRHELRDIPDLEIEIYTYKNELACIKVEAEDEDFEMEWLFKGGDFRTQNMELSIYEYGSCETMILEGSKDGSTEEYELSIEGDGYSYDIGTLEYDHKSGDFSIENDYDEISGNINASGNSVAVTVEYDDVEMMVSVAKGAKLADLKGEEFDIGTATREDFEDISEEFEDWLY